MARRLSRQTQRDSRGSSSEGPRSRRGQNRARHDENNLRSSRMGWPFAFFLLALAIIGLQHVRIQILDAAHYSQQSDVGRSYTSTLIAKRGTIYDRNGNVLAVSQDCQDIQCDPSMIQRASEAVNPEEWARILQKHLGGELGDYLDKFDVEGNYALLKRGVDDNVAEALMEELYAAQLPGIFSIDSSKRVYPYGSLAGQILGRVGNEGQGLTGLELYYDDILSGKNGTIVYEYSGYEKNNTPIAGSGNKVEAPREGTSIVLTLDANIQMTVEQAVLEATKHYTADMGMAMVTNPTTGEILAACSTPYLDPADAAHFDPLAAQLRLVSESYEPGSMFKVFTASIGIGAGLFDATTSFEVPAVLLVGSDPVRDEEERSETEYMSVSDIITHSSNIGAVLLGREIGAELFSQGVAQFGIGSPTGIDFPGEVGGLVRDVSDYGGEDGSTTLGSMSFGQGLAIPMVQMVRGVGALATDGRLRTPHFLRYKGNEEVSWPVGERASTRHAAQLVREMMANVVAEGTGVAAQMAGFELAGKTGTGEQADPDGGGYRQNYFLSSFVGFGPTEDPQLLCYVGLLGTSHLAAASAVPTFSTIMDEALLEMGLVSSAKTRSQEELGVQDDIDAQEEMSAQEEMPVQEEMGVQEETLAQEEMSVQEETGAQEELDAQNDIGVQEESVEL